MAENLLLRLQIDAKNVDDAIRKIKQQLDEIKNRPIKLDIDSKNSLDEIKNLTTNLKTLQSTKLDTKSVDAASGSFMKLAGAVGLGMGAYDALINVGKKAIAFFKESISAAIEEEKQNSRLYNSLNKNMDSYTKMIEFREKNFRSTTFSKDDINSAISMSLQLGRTEEQTKKMIIAAEGLSKATGQDLQTVMMQLSASLEGTKGRMGKFDEEIKNMTVDQLKAGGAIDVIAEKFGKFATGGINTANGAINQYEKSIEELKETIGLKFTNAIADGYRELTKLNDALTDLLKIPVSQKFEEENAAMNSLVETITSLTNEDELRIKLLNELQTTYPQYFGQLDIEKVKNNELISLLKDINKEYEKKIKLMILSEKQAELDKESMKAYKNKQEALDRINETYKEIFHNAGEGLKIEDKLEAIRLSEGTSKEMINAERQLEMVITSGTQLFADLSSNLKKAQDEVDAVNDKFKDIKTTITDIKSQDKIVLDVETNINEINEKLTKATSSEEKKKIIKNAEERFKIYDDAYTEAEEQKNIINNPDAKPEEITAAKTKSKEIAATIKKQINNEIKLDPKGWIDTSSLFQARNMLEKTVSDLKKTIPAPEINKAELEKLYGTLNTIKEKFTALYAELKKLKTESGIKVTEETVKSSDLEGQIEILTKKVEAEKDYYSELQQLDDYFRKKRNEINERRDIVGSSIIPAYAKELQDQETNLVEDCSKKREEIIKRYTTRRIKIIEEENDLRKQNITNRVNYEKEVELNSYNETKDLAETKIKEAERLKEEAQKKLNSVKSKPQTDENRSMIEGLENQIDSYNNFIKEIRNGDIKDISTNNLIKENLEKAHKLRLKNIDDKAYMDQKASDKQQETETLALLKSDQQKRIDLWQSDINTQKNHLDELEEQKQKALETGDYKTAEEILIKQQGLVTKLEDAYRSLAEAKRYANVVGTPADGGGAFTPEQQVTQTTIDIEENVNLRSTGKYKEKIKVSISQFVEQWKKGWKEVEGEVIDTAINGTIQLIADGLTSMVDAQLNAIQVMTDNSLKQLDEAYEKSSDNLDDLLKGNFITQEQYDKKKEDLDKQKAEKEKELKTKQFEAEKEAALIKIIIDTASSVMMGYAQGGPIIGSVLAAIAIAAGAIEYAEVESQPTPEFKKGGMVEGPSHENGGVPMKTPNGQVELEGGEYIINKETVKKRGMMKLLDEINNNNFDSITKKYSRGGLFNNSGRFNLFRTYEDGGYVYNSKNYSPIKTENLFNEITKQSTTIINNTTTMDVEELKNVIREVTSIPVVVSEVDITKTQRKVAVTEQRSSW